MFVLKLKATTMRSVHMLILMIVAAFSVVGCSSPSVPGSPGVPEPIKVLENPTTGERVRFFREIPYKVPTGYSEVKNLADWSATQAKAGFTKEITPEADRESLAELRRKNRAAAQQ
jgi:hypothetical protein